MKQSTEIRCKNLYEKYKKMGEDNLRKRYSSNSIIDSCLNLYKNNSWSFSGKNLIDEKYEIQSFQKSLAFKSIILSKTKIGNDQYLIKFNVCKEQNSKQQFLLITTDKEQFSGKIPRPMNSQCASFWTQIISGNPDNTQFTWLFDNISASKTMKKLL